MGINFDKAPLFVQKEINFPKGKLQRGSSGMGVQRVQEWLQYHECSTAIDGKYGPATASSVKDFQSMMGISPTGRVTRDTWAELVRPMQNALAAPTMKSNEAAPVTVARVAMQHVSERPHEIGGENRGPWVRLYCEGNDGRQWAWCAGFVSLIIQQAFFYRGESAPIKGSVSCDILASQAKKNELFVPERHVTNKKVLWDEFQGACLFLRRRTSTDWTHTGIATIAEGSVKELVFHTIEGNTNDDGVREGYEACQRKRSVVGTHYDFVSFVDLE